MAAGRRTVERWRYAGEREVGRGTAHLWIDEAGGERLYVETTGASVGAVYEVEVTHDGERTTLHGYPKFVEARHDELTTRWEAEHRAATTANALRKAEARARREGPDRFGELTLRELRGMLARAPAPRAAALLAQVLRYVGRP